MPNQGRKRSTVEEHFRPYASDAKVRKVECKFCGYVAMWNATRLADHISKCKGKYPSLVSDSQVTVTATSPCSTNSLQDKNGETLIPSSSSLTVADEKSDISNFKSNTCSGRGLSAFVCMMSKTRQELLQRKLAKSIFSGGVPFRYVENKHFIEWAKEMNPSFKVPSRREISGRLLSHEDEATSALVLERIRAAPPKSLTLATDGWTNVTGDYIINYIVCDPNPMFFNSVAPKERHTGNYST